MRTSHLQERREGSESDVLTLDKKGISRLVLALPINDV